MKVDSVVEYRNPGIALPVVDVLTEVLRNGARELLQQAVEAEVAEFVKQHRALKDEHERQRVVRNGYRAQRTIQTGIGEVAVKAPRARPSRGDQVSFKHSAGLPATDAQHRRAAALVILERSLDGRFLRSVSGPVGKDARGLSAANISRLKEVWKSEYEHRSRRDLHGKNFVYLWVDGGHLGAVGRRESVHFSSSH